MKPDLHCHSHLSDGKHPVSFLIERALAKGVTHLAITDHDCTEAHDALGDNQAVAIIPGVEISSAWEKHEIHVVGLCINCKSPQLQKLLAAQQAKRRQRVQRIDEKLSAQGIQGLLPWMAALPAVAQTRSQVADFLVQRQICKNREKVFKHYLNKKGRAYVAAQWCSLGEAVATITRAGGIATLAHPGRYAMSRSKLSLLVGAFKEAGGVALECSYPQIAPNMQALLLKHATNQGLYASCGSDFHDADATWTDVGKFPGLPESAQQSAVWHHPQWRQPNPHPQPNR